MKINPINIYTFKNNTQKASVSTKKMEVYSNNPLPHYNEISFQGAHLKYANAKNYLKETTEAILKEKNNAKITFKDFDLSKLEGIQEGIKVFKNMTMKEIAFLLGTIESIAITRGCANGCAHCYADAKPSLAESDKTTSRMKWNDFESLIDGVNELNKRLGFNSTHSAMKAFQYVSPFFDSDGIDIYMIDDMGNEHDFIEISQKLRNAFDKPVIFDTAGWNINDVKAQKRAEKYAEFFSKDENSQIVAQFNISFNPFHALNKKAVEMEKEGKTEIAEKLRQTYIKRMANAFYTLTPLIKKEKFGILTRVSKTGDFGLDNTDVLLFETLMCLREMYDKDLKGEQKYVTSESEIDEIINIISKKGESKDFITYTEKPRRELELSEKEMDSSIAMQNFYENNFRREMDIPFKFARMAYEAEFNGLIDANGDYYLTSLAASAPTELKLNFENQKETAEIGANLKPEFLITKKRINE